MPSKKSAMFESHAYIEGQAAYELGLAYEDNPFWFFTRKREDWNTGYTKAKADFAKSKNKDMYYFEGQDAYHAGKPRQSPYAENARWDTYDGQADLFWLNGYNAAERAAEPKSLDTDPFETFNYTDIYQEGWKAYQQGRPSSPSPYDQPRHVTDENFNKHLLWQKGYGDAERAADPDGLAPRPTPYIADINIPRERLFSTDDDTPGYYLFVVTFNTETNARLRVLYVQARNQSEAFGHVALHLSRNKERFASWRIEQLNLYDLEKALGENTLTMVERVEGVLKTVEFMPPAKEA